MATNDRLRTQFFHDMATRGFSYDTIRAILRDAATIQRLAVAQCNGDYPADNGQRDTRECPRCGSHWSPADFRKSPHHRVVSSRWPHGEMVCGDCRATLRIDALLKDSPLKAVCGGDPRGCCVRLYARDASEQDIDSGRARSIDVPAPRY